MGRFVPRVFSLLVLSIPVATVAASASNPLGVGVGGIFGTRWRGVRGGSVRSGSVAGENEVSELHHTATASIAPATLGQGILKGNGDDGRLILTRVAEFILTSEVISAIPAPATRVITAINTAVFILWGVADDDASLRRFMNKHFLHTRRIVHTQEDDTTRENKGKRATRLVSPPHTALTSAFSQQDVAHFSANMGALAVFGKKLLESMGNRAFSYFYVASIYASHFFDTGFYQQNFDSITSKRILFFFRRDRTISLGASGAISAVITYYCLRFPTDWLKLSDLSSEPDDADDKEKHQTEIEVDDIYQKWYNKVRVRAWALGLFYFASDVFRWNGDNIGYGAHIGGSVFGAAVYIVNILFGAQIRKAAAMIMADVNVVTRRLSSALAALRSGLRSACKAAWVWTRPLRAVSRKVLKCVFGTFGAVFWKILELTGLFLDTLVAVVLEVVDFQG